MGIEAKWKSRGIRVGRLPCGPLDKISAVSYTHLDVYKRQDFHGDMDFKVGGTRKGITAIPVSYTHLDVYKRQAFSRVES